MPIKRYHIIFSVIIACLMASCSPKNISSKYYYQNKEILDKIEVSYKSMYSQTPFTVGFTSKNFRTVSLEIITDTLIYIYEFDISEPRMADTLTRYKLNTPKVIELIKYMFAIRCTWIKNFDYYVDEKKNSLIFLSIKPVALKAPFSYKKYYILTYFSQKQYFDENGLLLDKRKQRRLRKINGERFKRINDKVCYTVSGKFR